MGSEKLDLEKLKELHGKASALPWEYVFDHGDMHVKSADGTSLSCDMQYYPWTFGPDNSELLVYLRNHVPTILEMGEENARLWQLISLKGGTIEVAGFGRDSLGTMIRYVEGVERDRDHLRAQLEAAREAIERLEEGGADPLLSLMAEAIGLPVGPSGMCPSARIKDAVAALATLTAQLAEAREELALLREIEAGRTRIEPGRNCEICGYARHAQDCAYSRLYRYRIARRPGGGRE